ncbi:PREDICTED: E3 ubiquitin-protein ligase RING2-A-like, partial [Pseudopodoces humilis]|uniref:E3 ubiquitin-protein ligase RING2-A-like n=1 Tax=Pseudopodoces humilis TaxID=181119 RepID=UPI0006B79E60
AQRVRKLAAESDPAAFSGGEEGLESLGTPPEPPGPSRKRSRASDDSGPDAEAEAAAEGAGPGGGGAGPGGRGSPEAEAEAGSSEIELVFRPHPLLVEKGEYCQTRPFPPLNGSLTLELVNEKFWKLSKPLELYYAPTKEQK